jgi:hypothetical protein
MQRQRGRDGREHEQELEVPVICARKVETTPVPDLNIYDDDTGKGRKGVNVSTGMKLKHVFEMGLALFPDRA